MLVSQAQKYDIPLNYGISQELLQVKVHQDSMLHMAIKPINQWYISDRSFNNLFKDTGDYYYNATVLLYQKHLLEIHKKDVHIGMDPLLDLFFGRRYYETAEGYEKQVSTNSRGFRVVANIGKNISFETRFYENQFFYPHYIDSIVARRSAALGVGRAKPFKTAAWDVGNSYGTVSYKINDQINLKFGHDKVFIGHGYRSLFISDNASNYPYLALNLKSKNGKWQYFNANTWMQTLKRTETTVSTEALFRRKDNSIHYLSFKPSPKLELGIFESTIYKRFDDSLGVVSAHPTFYNPVIGVNTIVNGLQGENNSVIGISASYSLKNTEFYSQAALDDIDKIALQVGLKWLSPFGLSRNWFQFEVNSVPKYMYGHTDDNRFQNYSHMNQELAHPIGASFTEVLTIYHFEKNHWFANAQFNFTYRVRGDIQQLGENIFRATDSDMIDVIEYQDIQTYYWKLEGGYEFNIKSRFQIFGQCTQRILINQQDQQSNQSDFFFVAGVRCNLNNYYFDL